MYMPDPKLDMKYFLSYKYLKYCVLITLLEMMWGFTYSQSNDTIYSEKSDTALSTKPAIKMDSLQNKKDIIDVFVKGLHIKNNTQRDVTKKEGLGPYVSIFPAVGYILASGIVGALASNVAFFTDKEKNKISSVLIGIFYSQYNQSWSIINSNIFLKKEKFIFVGDWRYYKFPTVTYGLGSNSVPGDADNIDYYYLKLYEVVYERLATNLYLGPGYHLDYHFNVRENNSTAMITDFQKYGLNKKSFSSGVSINLLYDNRSNSVNPPKGTYFNIQFRQNYTFLGSDQNWKFIFLDMREYVKYPAQSKNVLAFWCYDNFSIGTPPYLDLPSIGWDAYNNTGRGYVQGRFRGKNMIYFESEYRFSLTRNGLFGGVVFINMETFSEWPSNNFGRIMPGYGLGLRIKLNKFSGTNLTIDYGFGKEGSKGLSFSLGELF